MDGGPPPAPGGPLIGFLALYEGKSPSGEFWPVYAGQTTIGRSKSCTIMLKQMGMSSKHCTILTSPEGKQIAVRDEGSTNGTYVNSQRVVGRMRVLNDNDNIRLGGTMLLFKLLPRG